MNVKSLIHVNKENSPISIIGIKSSYIIYYLAATTIKEENTRQLLSPRLDFCDTTFHFCAPQKTATPI